VSEGSRDNLDRRLRGFMELKLEELRASISVTSRTIVAVLFWSVFLAGFVAVQPSLASMPTGCTAMNKPGIEFHCEEFRDTTYGVATADLNDAEVLFYWDHSATRGSSFDVVGRAVEGQGVVPVIATNGGIYENSPARPEGLLIDRGKTLQSPNTGPGSGNFFWNSTVVRISSEHQAYMLPVKDWNQGLAVATTEALQSGPRLITDGKIETSISPESHSRYTRTALCLTGQGSRQITLVVSQQEVTLFQLSSFLVEQLHCREALHLDGAVSSVFDFTNKTAAVPGQVRNDLVTFVIFGLPKHSIPK
jgi:uncharacterized protein YigE (DUF2233 family)